MAKRRKLKRKSKRGPNAKKRGSVVAAVDAEKPKRDFTALIFSLSSYLLLWLAMPGPARGNWWLAWVALVPMCWLVQSPVAPHKVLRQVWVASLMYWLLMLHFVRLPIWMLWFGWLLLAGYLSIYGPLFVSISRTLVHRFRMPTVFAVPVVFTGLEWIRVTFLTGFGLGCVSHSQYQHPPTMQIAEFWGAYGITFAILFVAAALAVATSFAVRRLTVETSIPVRLVHAILAMAMAFGVIGFGSYRLSEDAKLRKTAEPHKHLKVAIIQSSIDTILKPKSREEIERNFKTRRDLTHSARLVAKDTELVIWPESSFAYWDYLSDVDAINTKEVLRELQLMAWQDASGMPALFLDGVPMVAGSTTLDPQGNRVFNSALFFDVQGDVKGRYFKNHLVMFGEYFPVVHSVPFLKELLKGFRSLNPGTEFSIFKVKDVSLAPNICFESTVPHLIRRQINSLEESGGEIDVMVNVTNDGWFFGTSCLDLHLACNTLRAVEMRKPILVSANTGLSGHIDEFGRHVEVGPRRKEAKLICDVRVPLPATTVYRTWGGWVACVMGWIVVVAGGLSFLPAKEAVKSEAA